MNGKEDKGSIIGRSPLMGTHTTNSNLVQYHKLPRVCIKNSCSMSQTGNFLTLILSLIYFIILKYMNWKQTDKQMLLDAFLVLRDREEAALFLRDLMTEAEIEEFSRRLQAADMLQKKIVYTEIVKKTGLSSTTVARVAKWLNGKGAGYKSVLAKVHHTRPLRS